jgi:hypothetical protein
MKYFLEMLQEVSERAWSWANARSRQIKIILGIFLILAVLVSSGYQILVNWQEVRSYPWKWDVKFLFLGFGVYSINLLLTASIWALIMRRLSGIKSFFTHIGLYSLTNLAQRLPTLIPYISARTEAYAARDVPRSTTLTAMSLEVIVTITGALVVAIATLPFGLPGSLGHYSMLIWFLLIPFIVFVIRPDWLFVGLNKIFVLFKHSPLQVRVNKSDTLLWVGLFAIIWLIGGLFYFILANSIYPVVLGNLLMIVNIFAISGIVGWAGQFLFFVPNLAARQVAAAYLLSFFMPWLVAVAVVLVVRLSVLIFELIWALVFSILLKTIKI